PDDLRIKVAIAQPRFTLGERERTRQVHFLRLRSEQFFVLLKDRRHLGRRIIDAAILMAQRLPLFCSWCSGHCHSFSKAFSDTWSVIVSCGSFKLPRSTPRYALPASANACARFRTQTSKSSMSALTKLGS